MQESLGELLAEGQQHHDNPGSGAKTMSAGHLPQEARQIGLDQETAGVPRVPRGLGCHQGHGQSQGQTAHARTLAGRASLRVGAGPRGFLPLSRCRATNAESPSRQGQQVQVGPILWQHRQGQIRRRTSIDGMALGQGGCQKRRRDGDDLARAEDRHSHPATQLRTPPVDEQHTDQLPVALAGTLVDPDDAHLPGVGTGPVTEPGPGPMST